MRKHVLVLTTTAAILGCGAIAASAQGPGSQPTPGGPMMQDQDDYHRYHHGGMMGGGMMGGGMMDQGCGRGMMGSMAMRIIFSLMDADGDGTVSLQEWQAAHERIFKSFHAWALAGRSACAKRVGGKTRQPIVPDQVAERALRQPVAQ